MPLNIHPGLPTSELHLRVGSMHRSAVQRLLPSLTRLQPSGYYAAVSCRSQATQAEPKASQGLLDKMKDKNLLKVHGFIGGQWVGAADGSTMEVCIMQHAQQWLLCLNFAIPTVAFVHS